MYFSVKISLFAFSSQLQCFLTFLDPPTENTTELGYSYPTDGNLSVNLYMEVFPVPNCTIEFEVK